MYLIIGLLFIIGSSLLLHMVLFAEAFMWVPKHSKDTLFISALIGFLCAIESLILSSLTRFSSQYRHVIEDPSDLYIHDRELSPINSTDIANHTSGGDISGSNHNQYNRIPVKRPDQANNQRPSLGHTQNKQKPNHRYRQGYHYQPIASTSRQSPTFILDDKDSIIPGPSSSCRSNEHSSV